MPACCAYLSLAEELERLKAPKLENLKLMPQLQLAE